MSFCSDDQHTTNMAAVTSPANSGETDKASPVITVKPNFVAFVLSGTASFSFIGENLSFVTEANREADFARRRLNSIGDPEFE